MKRQKGKISGTMVFTIFVMALAAYVFFFVYEKGEKETEKKKADEKIFAGMELSKVQSLVISPNAMNHNSDIKLTKKGSDWELQSPVKDFADKDAVETFVKTLLDEKTQESLGTQGIDLKTFGLDHPKGSLTVSSNSDNTQVNIGSVKAYDGNLYSLISSKPGVYLLSSTWDAYVDKKPKDFRLKKVERSHFKNWTRVKTKIAGKPHLDLQKVDDQWQSNPKSEIPLQNDLVEGFIFQMANLEVLDFVDETKTNLAKYGLAKPKYEIALSGDENKKPHDFKLQLSEKSPDESKQNASATSSELNGVVKVYASILDVAGRGVDYFLNRKYPFQYDPTKASKLKIKMPELTLVAEKKNGSWQKIESSSKLEIDSANLEELTRALSRLATSDYLLEKGKGLDQPKNSIEVFDDKGASLTRFVWGEEYKPKNPDPANTNIKFYYAKASRVPKYTLTIKQTQLDELALPKLFKQAAPSPSPTPSSTPMKEKHP